MERSEEWILGDPAEPARAPTPPKSETKPARARTKRRGGSIGRLILFFLWTLLFLGGLVGVAAFATGVLRDGKFGDAVLAVDLAHGGEWTSAAFRPWVPGRYLLYVTTDDRTARETPLAFAGRISTRIVAPDGREEMLETFDGSALAHEIAGGEQWTRLAELHIIAPTYAPWTFSAQVVEGDPAFAGLVSSVLIRRDRKATGIDGLFNYALAAPSMVLLGLSFLIAIWLARRGGTWMPALLSLILLGAEAYLYWLVRAGV
jgi:hypothetical protein